MNVLILGAEGMLGRALMRELPSARGTTRGLANLTFDPRIVANVDIAERSDLERALAAASPQVVINCAGIVKSECERHPARRVAQVNGAAPHTIAELAAKVSCRVIHVSTDCVFDGSRGSRRETDRPDATDLYGQSKAAGELVEYDHCVTIRTSFIGRDPRYHRGLLEWLCMQHGTTISGFTQMVWSGLSAAELARVIAKVARETGPLALRGLYHVSGPVITKADLLELLVKALDLSVQVKRVDEPRIDRSLDGRRFREATSYVSPTWAEMAKELAEK